MNSRVEILAPAGSMESMMAAVQAGADAIYMGGSRFGAGLMQTIRRKTGSWKQSIMCICMAVVFI